MISNLFESEFNLDFDYEDPERQKSIQKAARRNWFGGFKFPELYFIYREGRTKKDFRGTDNVFCYYGMENTTVNKLFAEFYLNDNYYNPHGDYDERYQFKPLCLTVSLEGLYNLANDNSYIAKHGSQSVSHSLPKEFDLKWGLSRKGVPDYVLAYYCGTKFTTKNAFLCRQILPALLSNSNNWKINHTCIADFCTNI